MGVGREIFSASYLLSISETCFTAHLRKAFTLGLEHSARSRLPFDYVLRKGPHYYDFTPALFMRVAGYLTNYSRHAYMPKSTALNKQHYCFNSY